MFALLCALVATLLCAPAANAGPARYTLAIGDSVPYGVVNGTPGSGARFTSFVDVLEQRLQPVRPGHTAVNFSCPETTTTALIGPAASACQGNDQYDPHSGSQLDAALAFLAAHPGEVSPIVVTAGGNDLLAGDDLGAMQARVGQIVTALRAAAPAADLVVTGYGDPQSLGEPGQAARYVTHAAFNQRLRTAANGAGAVFVDPHPVFNAPPDDQDAAICTYLLACQAGDPHPSAAGHGVYANLIWAALGYDAVTPPVREQPDPPAGGGGAERPTSFGTPSSAGTKVETPQSAVLGEGAVAAARFGAPRLAADRRSLRVWVRCATRRMNACRIRVVVRQGGRRLGVARVRLAPGRTATVRVRLTRRAARGKQVQVSAYVGDAARPAVRLTAR
ncbi:MAG: SGNH/GDSL hydrolase family protein [Solirubrobacteraceae bacterium]